MKKGKGCLGVEICVQRDRGLKSSSAEEEEEAEKEKKQ